MKRIRSVSLLLAAVLFLSVLPVFVSAGSLSGFEASAAFLKELGLFRGVSDDDFDLSRCPTRVEAVVMVVRLMGEEDAALGARYPHPFTDVPAWADDYVGYAYARGITNGVSPDRFGADTAVTTSMYLTFLLRVLGYSDTAGDFDWGDPYPLASRTGILTEEAEAGCSFDTFRRADMAYLSRTALTAVTKAEDWPLAALLVKKGAFTSREFIAATLRYRDSFSIPPRSASGGVDVPDRSSPTDGLISDWYPGVPLYDEAGREIYFVNLESGKIHRQGCRYCDFTQYSWPTGITADPYGVISRLRLENDPWVYSWCQVCCRDK